MLVSIIISAYNVEKYVEKCLNSVINNTYKNIEIIIIEDCSTDNTLNIIKKFSDSRIKLITNSQNKGAGVARYLGCNAATGDFLTFIDSDDYIDVDYIETLVNYLKKTDSDFIQCHIITNNNLLFNHSLLNGGLFSKEIYKHDYSIIRYLEDTATYYKWWSVAKKHSVLPKENSGYYWVCRKDSLTQSHNHLLDITWNIIAAQEYLNFLKTHPVRRIFKFAQFVCSFFYINYAYKLAHKSSKELWDLILKWNENNNSVEIINSVKYIENVIPSTLYTKPV